MANSRVVRKKKPRSITVHGRRWFNKGPGNTYHSARIYVDGHLVHTIEFAYGYGEQYLWNARNWLKHAGYLPGIEDHDNGGGEMLWRYCERIKCKFAYDCADVQRKKDL